MHPAIYRQWHRSQPAWMIRLRSAPDSVVACVNECNRTPAWIAKHSVTPAGMQRLRKERDALECLSPWAQVLGTPALIDAADGDGEVCIIQQGLAGEPLHLKLRFSRTPWGLRALEIDPPDTLERVTEWLEHFHWLVPSPRRGTMAEFATEFLRHYRSVMVEPSMDSAMRSLADVVDTGCLGGVPLVAAHGDFWHGNILIAGEKLRVFDWNGFDAGSPLDDLFTCLLKCTVVIDDHPAGFAEAFLAALFAQPQVRATLREVARRFRLAPEEARACFYTFLTARLAWELGYAAQPRSQRERAVAIASWKVLLRWLEVTGYPDPWTSDAVAAGDECSALGCGTAVSVSVPVANLLASQQDQRLAG